jgi:hypothetical protein
MMNSLVPLWILGAPFVGLLILLFGFKGPSAMGGHLPRPLRGNPTAPDESAPLLQPMHPGAVRRNR